MAHLPMFIPSSDETDQHVHPVRRDAGDESADGVGKDGLGGQFPVAEGVEHGGVGAEVAAPAHADGGEHGDGVAVNPAFRHEVGHQSQGGAHGTEGGNRECHQVRVGEAEEPFEHEAHFVCQPGQCLDTLVGGSRVAFRSGSEGQNHHQRGDNQYAGDDGDADVHTRASAVEQGVEDAEEENKCWMSATSQR